VINTLVFLYLLKLVSARRKPAEAVENGVDGSESA
jgi:hypothetical protein